MNFSVVIPLFNKEKHILRAINSVLSQTHPDFEIVIIDDGSTDNSVEVISCVHDSRLHIYQQNNQGVAVARNQGVKFSKSNWVAFLDADDEYCPTFLEEVNHFLLKNNQDLSFIGTNYYLGSKELTANPLSIHRYGTQDYFKLFKNQCSPNNSSSTVVNKYYFNLVGGFPEGVKQFEDWITWFKLAIAGNFGYISYPLSIYHTTENSVSNSKRKPTDFYRDAVLLPVTINHILVNQKFRNKEPIKECLSSFSLSIAEILARDGYKLLSVKMLLKARIKHLITKSLRKLLYLIFHLIIPQSIKRIYWKYRWGSNI